MVVSKHERKAFLVGSPDIELSIKDGSISLGALQVPHVEASLDIALPGTWSLVSGKPVWTPKPATLLALDPRQNKRVRIEVNATFTPGGAQTRTFDLGLRDLEVGDGQVSLQLASDEALLEDHKPLTDDITPRTHEASLRSVVNYALNKVIPGKSLEATPSVNADATRYWSITNLVANPSGEADAAGPTASNWSVGQYVNGTVGTITMGTPAAPFGTRAVGWTSLAGGDSNIIPVANGDSRTYGVTPGRWYCWSFYICSTASRTARAAIQWWSANGSVLSSQVFSAPITTVNSEFRRVSIIAQAPEGTSHAFPYVNVPSSAVTNHYVDGAMFYEGDEVVPFFSGATTDSSTYTYKWSNAANASTSTRTPIRDVDKESLTWKAGQSAMDFLKPLVQVAGFRLVCDENRKWTLRDEDFRAAETLSIRHGVGMIEGSYSISRDADLWYDAALIRYVWTDLQGMRREAVDYHALTTPYIKLRTFEKDTPYPGPGLAQYLVRRAQGRGREVTASAVADWRARAEQPVEIVLENAPIQLGTVDEVTFDLGQRTMTVTTRTTDTPASAWDLIPAGSSWTSQPVGGSWNGESI